MKTTFLSILALPSAKVLAEYMDCSLGDSYCTERHGFDTYCKYYSEFSVCKGTVDPCNCEGTVPVTTLPPETPKAYDCSAGDFQCQEATGYDMTYCNYWSGNYCHGFPELGCSCEDPNVTPQPVVSSCEDGDGFCRDVVGDFSYCKFYQSNPPRCQGSNVRCFCSGTTTHTPTQDPTTDSTTEPSSEPTTSTYTTTETSETSTIADTTTTTSAPTPETDTTTESATDTTTSITDTTTTSEPESTTETTTDPTSSTDTTTIPPSSETTTTMIDPSAV